MMVLQGDQMAWKEKDLKEAFRTFDSDDKGFMHAAELKYVLMRMDDPGVTEEDVKEMLADTGLNINRKITFKGINIFMSPTCWRIIAISFFLLLLRAPQHIRVE